MDNLKFRIILNKIFEFLIFIFAFFLLVPLFLIIFMIIQKGISVINFEFIFSTEIPQFGSKEGGILSNILGTLLIVIVATAISVPIGIATGTYLSENRKGKITFIIQWCVDILQGIPSIIFGLVIYLWVVKTTGKFSGFSGSLALGFMMLPVIVKTTEETMNMIPAGFKEASIALGVPYYKTIIKIVIPTSLSGIVTGVLLGVARVSGETAPLLFTAYGNSFFNIDMGKPIASLPHLIYYYATSPFAASWDVAWGASFVLVTIILCLNLITKLAVKKWKVQF
ncbi:MAG TPA: phosphate ABC transporter permease PstA [Spirochaetota bacterium]|nr:phosphate ABC transporter permease PstA [Spirochaetota bacterium]